MSNTIGLLHQVDTALKQLTDVELTVDNYIVTSKIKEIYRGLQSERATSSSKRIMIHIENLVRELNNLEDALKDGQLVLLKRVEHDEQKASS